MHEFTEPVWSSIALVTIDMQYDVLDGHPLGVEGTTHVVPHVSALCKAFRVARRPIVHMVRLYAEGGGDADLVRRHALSHGSSFLRPGTDGAEVVAGILREPVALDADLLLAGHPQPVGPTESVVYKPRWGAFFRAPLEQLLRHGAVTTIAVAGCNFPNCPRTTIYEASERDFRVVAARDAISGVYDRGINELLAIGVNVLSSSEIIDQLNANTSPVDVPLSN